MKSASSLLAIIASAFLMSCSGGGGGGSPTRAPSPQPSNTAPNAVAGADISTSLSAEGIQLDGSASSDPQNQTLTFRWTVLSQPSGASAVFNSATSATPRLMTLVPGTYEIELTVTDSGGLSSTDRVTLILSNDAPVLSIDPYQLNVETETEVQFNAAGSSDPNGHSLSYQWTLVSVPPGSNMALQYTGVAPKISFDVRGQYVLQLTVSDGFDSDTMTLDTITASDFTVLPLAQSYSKSAFNPDTETIIAIHDSSFIRLQADGTESNLTLPHIGRAIDISSDGTEAVVLHDNWVSHIDLGSMTIIGTYQTDLIADDIAFGPNNFTVISAIDGGSLASVYYIDLTDSGRVYGPDNIEARMTLEMHPSGDRVYAANFISSSNGLHRYDVSTNVVTLQKYSTASAPQDYCNNLFMGPSGSTLLTPCGAIVRLTEAVETDLTYVLTLDLSGRYITHASASSFTNTWYTLLNGRRSVARFDAVTGEAMGVLSLPEVDTVSGDVWMPRSVFASNQSNNVFVIAEDTSATVPTFALLKRGNGSSDIGDFAPVAVTNKYHTGQTGVMITLDGNQSYDPEGRPLTYSWSLTSAPQGSSSALSSANTAQASLTPDLPGTYTIKLKVNDGTKDSGNFISLVNVFANNTSVVHRLEGPVRDFEYNKRTNKAVYVVGDRPVLTIVDLDDFSERKVQLGKIGHTVGISPSGEYAVVSHSGGASLVNLVTATLADSQDHDVDWGDIILDGSLIAHLIADRAQLTDILSIDFSSNTIYKASGTRGKSQLRLHPNGRWIYSPDRGTSPSSVFKWDGSVKPVRSLGSAHSRSGYEYAGDLWISEDGSSFLSSGADLFRSSSTDSDMTHIASLQGMMSVSWADHSDAVSLWAAISLDDWQSNPRNGSILQLFAEHSLSPTKTIEFESIPGLDNPGNLSATHVYFKANGEQLVTLLMAENGLDNRAIQVSNR